MRRLNVVNRKQALKVVKELDAFPKVPENFQETTAAGGGVSILTFIFILVLVISEMRYYADTSLKFDYMVDTEVKGKLKINIDMTVAMRCELIGADILDQTGQDTYSFGQLNLDNAYFELSPKQKRYHEITLEVNRYLRNQYHAIQELLWLSRYTASLNPGMPAREDNPTGRPTACRVHGSLEVNKVAGNFHITAGKSIPVIPRGHAHLALMVNEGEYNFSHRIDSFSFGDPIVGIVNPLDGELLIANSNRHIFQYFMQVVPTQVRTYINSADAYQFSVTERNRTIDHASGSHGVPGIFVKYDLSPISIRVREEHRPYWQFLVRMCGIIGGTFAVSGMLHGGIGFLFDILCCRYRLGKYAPSHHVSSQQRVLSEEPLIQQQLDTPDSHSLTTAGNFLRTDS
ncbi:hypothetical protein ACJMK2_020074 [Sinanodonta woodiana]|uniref:Endoplasmic reticulum-Golgi intermediate compartment protein 2 n=1 Tax=Sinanodonta woodiana TaxID=1069815 RepID=A0ABD3TY82_SINWO